MTPFGRNIEYLHHLEVGKDFLDWTHVQKNKYKNKQNTYGSEKRLIS